MSKKKNVGLDTNMIIPSRSLSIVKCAAILPARYAIDCVLVERVGETGYVVATDGKILSAMSFPSAGDSFRIVVKRHSWSTLGRFGGSKPIELRVVKDADGAYVATAVRGRVTVDLEMSAMPFPGYSEILVLTKDYRPETSVDARLLRKALSLSSDRYQEVLRISYGDDPHKPIELLGAYDDCTVTHIVMPVRVSAEGGSHD